MKDNEPEKTPFERVMDSFSFSARHNAVLVEMEAENARLRSEGHVFHGCDPRDVGPEVDEKALVKAARAASEALHKARCEAGLHFVSCGHPTSHVPMHKWNRL